MFPYLFLLCMDKSTLLIHEKVEVNQWLPIMITNNGPTISHLFFVDDCLLFTIAKVFQVRLVNEDL